MNMTQDFTELTNEEMRSTEGGILSIILAIGGCYAFACGIAYGAGALHKAIENNM